MTGNPKNDDNTSGSGFTADVLPVVTRITDNKLDGSNFFEWSKTVRIYLRSIGKASHLEDDPHTYGTKCR